MKLYLDTCIISGLAKGDLDTNEIASLETILLLHKKGEVSLVTSEVAKEEIDKIPQKYRIKHMTIYSLLSNVPTAPYLVLDLGFGVMMLGVKQHEIFKKLSALLKDEEDAKHIYQASQSNIDYFVTVDAKTILAKAREIETLCNIKAVSPTEFRSMARSIE